jgi:hypothetical protein
LADVFISCSRLDHERVKPIADRLTSLGYSIWWDRHAGQAVVDEIERQLDAARVVLAVWSRNARNSTWVYAEASRGLEAGKLLQLRLDGAPPPSPFDALYAADMSGSGGAWGPLEDALARTARGEAPPAPPPRAVPGPFATPQAAGAPKLLTMATTAALAACAAAASAAYNGVLTPDQLQIALVGAICVGGVSAALSAYRLIAVSRAGG